MNVYKYKCVSEDYGERLMFIVEGTAMLAERYIDKKVFPRYFLINFKPVGEVKGAQGVGVGIWKML